MTINIGDEEHVGLIGKTRSGKTYFSKNVLLSYFRRILVVDTEERGEFPESEGWQTLNFDAINSTNKDLIATFSGIPVDKQGRPPAFKWVVPFPTTKVGLQKNELLCYMILKYGARMSIYYDEVSDFCNAHWIGEQMTSLMRKSGKRKINVIWTSQRLQMVNKDIFANTHHMFVFNIEQYDAFALRQVAPYILENLHQVPFRSYRAIYHSPTGELDIVTAGGQATNVAPKEGVTLGEKKT